MTVAGVLPPTFDFGAVFAPGTKIDVFVPVVMDEMRNWGNTLALIGRLRPGVSAGQAQAEANILMPQLKEAHKWWGDYTSDITDLKEFVTGKLRRSMIALWSAVGLILLIVCVNISNLIQARAAARSKEFALRSALGAGRGRLIRQLLTESIVLSGTGALLGLGLAYAITRYLAHQGSIGLPLLSTVTIDGSALLWTLMITVSVAIIFGLVPIVRISGRNLQSALKDSGPGMSGGRSHERLRAVLVVSEVALACVLLVGAGLLLRSFVRLLDVDLGFQPSRAAVIQVDYEGANNPDRRGPVLQEMLRNIEAIPGVEAAGVADMLPLGRNRSWGLNAKGVTYPKEETLTAIVRVVTPGYLGAMGMRILNGRDFNWQDQPKSERVMILNQAAARRFFHMDAPVGRPGRQGRGDDVRVIGVIADVREHGLDSAPEPEMYLPVTQASPEGAELVVRTRLAPESLGPVVMKTLRQLNPAQPAAEFRPLQHIVDRSVSPRRFFVLLVGSFAALGLILASLGIYGVISYSVTRQTQEIGIRMALGASAPQVQRTVIGGALRLTAIGVAIGSIAALGVGKWIESMLYGTEPTDLGTFAGIILLLGTVAFIAGYIPARRASRIDPMIALRTS
ncbi:MAG: ADOP family duplicated permease, partial [Bryobacteraceae bacterium]